MHGYLRIACLLPLVSIVCFNLLMAKSQADSAAEKLFVLSEAMKPDDMDEVQRLLESGANVNYVSKNGMTLLHVASEKRHL